MRDTIVIGAGIIGATVTAALRKRGLDVLNLDDGRPLSGTAPSGGHLRPSWFGGMGKEQYEPAMQLLDETWRLKEETLSLWPLGNKVTVYRVDTDQVIRSERTQGRVTGVRCLQNFPIVTWDSGEERCRLLVVSAGAWCHELLSEIKTTAKQGVSFRIQGTLEQPLIRPWAPYKQVVCHQQGEHEIWAGDGSAILPQNWTVKRTQECYGRCLDALGINKDSTSFRALTGLRPYADKPKEEPCLLKQLGPRAWVATGAGKMGTIAAGFVACKLLSQLPS